MPDTPWGGILQGLMMAQQHKRDEALRVADEIARRHADEYRQEQLVLQRRESELRANEFAFARRKYEEGKAVAEKTQLSKEAQEAADRAEAFQKNKTNAFLDILKTASNAGQPLGLAQQFAERNVGNLFSNGLLPTPPMFNQPPVTLANPLQPRGLPGQLTLPTAPAGQPMSEVPTNSGDPFSQLTEKQRAYIDDKKASVFSKTEYAETNKFRRENVLPAEVALKQANRLKALAEVNRVNATTAKTRKETEAITKKLPFEILNMRSLIHTRAQALALQQRTHRDNQAERDWEHKFREKKFKFDQDKYVKDSQGDVRKFLNTYGEEMRQVDAQYRKLDAEARLLVSLVTRSKTGQPLLKEEEDTIAAWGGVEHIALMSEQKLAALEELQVQKEAARENYNYYKGILNRSGVLREVNPNTGKPVTGQPPPPALGGVPYKVEPGVGPEAQRMSTPRAQNRPATRKAAPPKKEKPKGKAKSKEEVMKKWGL